MQRPLVRRRHTVFPNKELRQLCDSSGVHVDERSTELQTRPGLDRGRKTQSFSRPCIVVRHSQLLQHALATDVMADDDTVTSPPTSPTAGE